MENKNAGFSLVELAITLTIMAALVGMVAPLFIKYYEKSKESKAIYTAEAYRVAVEAAVVHAAAGTGPESNPALINKPQAFSSSNPMPGNSLNEAIMYEVCNSMHAGPDSKFEAIALVDNYVVQQVTFHDEVTDKVFVWYIAPPKGSGLQEASVSVKRNEWVVFDNSSNWVSRFADLSSVSWNGSGS